MKRIAIVLASLAIVGFVYYIGTLYRQLEQAFQRQDEFIPMRIYSDVTRIAPPQSRRYVESRLSALGYRPEAVENTLRFNLHEVDFPMYLIPDNESEHRSRTQEPVSLTFDGSDSGAVLETIHIGENEYNTLYLEPELIATLARGSGQDGTKIREYLSFSDIPANVWKAFIAVEDHHFLEHRGFDPRGFLRALWVNIRTLSFAQGGSTITQQLVKNLMTRRTKDVFKKINEIFLAIILEIKFEKEQILERYLNEVYLGQIGNLEVHGVAEGARHFYSKDLNELNLAEIAMIAGLIRGPGYYSPYRFPERASARQKVVLQRMVETGAITEAESQAAARFPVRFAPPSTVSNKAPYFTDFVKAELVSKLSQKMGEQEISHSGFKIYTTLDPYIGEITQQAVKNGVTSLEKRFKINDQGFLEGAAVVVDHQNGQIKALVGGKDYARSTFNRILNMKRQVGSTFKPFVYLAAFRDEFDPEGVPYTPGYPMEDAPWTLKYDHGSKSWSPKNYEEKYLGWISLRTALAHSVNTVSAKLGVDIGLDSMIEATRLLGIQSDLPRVPSLSLGVAELSPVELVGAYAVLAHHGIQDELTVIRAITLSDGSAYARFIYHPKQIISSGLADLMTDLLQSVFTDGTAQSAAALGWDRPAAGKTGTTSDYRDSWFAGYTPELTAVVWVGIEQGTNQDARGRPIVQLTGAGSALPIWVDLMKKTLADTPPAPFPLSSQLIPVRIDPMTGYAAASDCPDEQVLMEKIHVDRAPLGPGSCAWEWPASEAVTEVDTLTH